MKFTDVKKDVDEKKDTEVIDSKPVWNGTWRRITEGKEGTLDIKDFNGDTFNMSLTVVTDGNPSGLNGEAKVVGDKATHLDAWYGTGCTITLAPQEDFIRIDGSPECSDPNGMATDFNGEYKLSTKIESNTNQTLHSKGIIDEQKDSDIKKILGADYAALVENMEVTEVANDIYGTEEILVLEGGVWIYGNNPRFCSKLSY